MVGTSPMRVLWGHTVVAARGNMSGRMSVAMADEFTTEWHIKSDAVTLMGKEAGEI